MCKLMSRLRRTTNAMWKRLRKQRLRPTMRYVEIKSEAQLEVQSLHRVRGRLVAERTALINQLRALMLERGIAVPQGRCKLERHLPEISATSATVSDHGFDGSLRTCVRSGGASTSGSKGTTTNSPNGCAMRTLPSD